MSHSPGDAKILFGTDYFSFIGLMATRGAWIYHAIGLCGNTGHRGDGLHWYVPANKASEYITE